MLRISPERIEAAIQWQRQLACRLVDAHNKSNANAVANDLQALLTEILHMARTNNENVDVLLKALADAKANAKTEDEKTALEKVAAAAALESPEAPPAP